MKKRHIVLTFGLLSLLLIFSSSAAHAQHPSFTYQGSLKLNGLPANGAFDFQFFIFRLESGGAPVANWDIPGVQVANGVFTVQLDTGGSIFTPEWSYIETRVRPAGGGAYTTLAPRRIVSTVPYAFRSINAANSLNATNAQSLGGIAASQYVLTSDARLSDARQPLPGSGSYIQNTAAAQTGNFNISGTGAANILSANEFFLGENKLISNGGFLSNVFFGVLAGQSNTSGSNNLFLGTSAGAGNTIGNSNVFAGGASGGGNTTGSNNSFFGSSSGSVNSTGSGNTFIGRLSGLLSATGNNNTALGFRTSVADGVTNATALGSQASVNQSNSLVLGSINGVNNATADTNVGIGTTTPASRLHVNGSVRVTNGAVFITNPNTVIITSPNGACWGITVNNSGQLSTFPVNPCP